MQKALTPKPTHRQGRRQHEYKSNIQQQCDSYWGGNTRGTGEGAHTNPTRHPVNQRFTRPVHKESSIPYGEASLPCSLGSGCIKGGPHP